MNIYIYIEEIIIYPGVESCIDIFRVMHMDLGEFYTCALLSSTSYFRSVPAVELHIYFGITPQCGGANHITTSKKTNYDKLPAWRPTIHTTIVFSNRVYYIHASRIPLFVPVHPLRTLDLNDLDKQTRQTDSAPST